MVMKDVGILKAIVQQPTVGFVADEEDLALELLFLLSDHLCETCQHILGVQRA